jgi:thiamine transport system permease protein
MARSPVALGPALLAGGLALGFVLALVLGAFGAVLVQADGLGALTSADWAAARFTLVQAALSAVLSVLFAVPVAGALARRRFAGRRLMILALGAPFILPVIVAVMGLLAIFGRAGVLNAGLAALGLPQINIYGLDGVLLAHVFLNLPLAVRLILNGWNAIPAERLRLAATLGFGPREVWRHLERPMLREVLPGAGLAIFLVCLSSFTVVLMMGGGPAATSVELALYQAFRLDFDLAHAATLAMLQMGLTLLAATLGLSALRPAGFGAGLDRTIERHGPGGRLAVGLDAIAIAGAAAFLGLPLLWILFSGIAWVGTLPATVWMAALRSAVIATLAAGLAVALALAIAVMLSRLHARGARVLDSLATLSLTASPFVIGTGLFLILRPIASPSGLALPLVTVINAVMAMPFCLRVLAPGVATLQTDYARLSASLGLTGAAWLRLVALPRLRGPLGFAAGLAAALSAGDLGVVALLADPGQATLPMQVHALAGAYRTGQAAGAAVLLAALAFGLFLTFERLGSRNADL